MGEQVPTKRPPIHGGHIVLSVDWHGQDWWRPRAYTIRTGMDNDGPIRGAFAGALGLGVFVILYEQLEPL